MVNELPEITFKAIGVVHNEVKHSPGANYPWQEVTTEITFDPGLTEALDNLEDFSHVIIIFWIHQSRGITPLKVRPRNNKELPLMGVLATRSPNRPNPIGKTTVRLIERRGNTLKVKGLDAINGTPVIDVKPYIPGYDSVDDAKVPKWIH